MSDITIRASSLPDLMDCSARWAARYIDGHTMPTSAAAQLGTAIHAGAAAYDQSALDKAGITPDEAAGAAVDAIHDPDREVDWSDLKPEKAEKKACEVHAAYCTEIAPQQDYTAVEITCTSLDIDIDGFVIRLTGTADRIRRTPLGLSIADIKTSKNAVGTDGTVKSHGHGAQLGVYSLIAEHMTGEPIPAPPQIIGLNTGAVRTGTVEVPNARQALIGEPNELGVLEAAAHIVKQGFFIGNPRSILCSKRYCPIHAKCKWR